MISDQVMQHSLKPSPAESQLTGLTSNEYNVAFLGILQELGTKREEVNY